MLETIDLTGALVAGGLLGALFFGGLWWTTRKGMASDNPALWFIGSLLLRTGAIAAGFYFVAGSDWRRALSCMLGFIAARQAVLLLAQRLPNMPSRWPPHIASASEPTRRGATAAEYAEPLASHDGDAA